MPVKSTTKSSKSTATTKKGVAKAAVMPGDEPVIDFSIEDKSFDPIPTGEYELQLQSRELTKSSKKGTPEVKVTFVIISSDEEGRKLWDDFYITQGSKWRFNMFFDAAGVDRPDGSITQSELVDMFEEGLTVKAVVVVETVDGKSRNKIGSYVK